MSNELDEAICPNVRMTRDGEQNIWQCAVCGRVETYESIAIIIAYTSVHYKPGQTPEEITSAESRERPDVRFGKFYTIAPDQLEKGEEVYLCEETYEKAVKHLAHIYPSHHPEVRYLQTVDSDTPFRDTADQPTPGHEATRFPSHRYGVVVTSMESPNE